MRPYSAPGARLNDVIGAIYDASLTPDGWPGALTEIKSLFNVANTAYLIHNEERSRIQRVTAEYDPEGQRLNIDSLLRTNHHFLRGKAGRPGQIARLSDILPRSAFMDSSMYQQFWRPRRLHDCLRVTIAVDPSGIYHNLNLHRGASSPAFDAPDIEMAHALMPHLQRCVELRRRLAHADLLAGSALSVLDTLPHGVLLLDRTGLILHANTWAERLVHGADGLIVAHGYLEAVTPSITARLRALIARASATGGGPARAGSLRVPRLTGERPLALLAMPFRRETHWTLPGGPEVLLSIADPHQSIQPMTTHFAALFGLTAAEASLAADLLTGLDTRDIAARRGRSVATVRTHLARLMAKADVSRQSDLIRVLGNLPRLPDAITDKHSQI